MTVEKWHAELRSSIRWQSGILGAWPEWDKKDPHFLGVEEAAEGLVLGRLDYISEAPQEEPRASSPTQNATRVFRVFRHMAGPLAISTWLLPTL